MRLHGTLAWLLPLSALALGCNAILGFDQDYKSGSAATGGGGTSTTGGVGGGTSTGGRTGGASTGGGHSGGGGAGGATPCTTTNDCPAPPNSCSQPVCESSVCGVVPTPEGTPAAQQTPGDCATIVCDGTGSIKLVADANDVPPASDECHKGSCEGGPPHQIAANSGLPCNGDHVCDSGGTCVECLMNSQCPMGVCAGNTCQSAGCGDGTKNGTETDVDCGGGCGPSCGLGKVCNGGGDCQSGYCTGGVCSLIPAGSGCAKDADCASGFCVWQVCCQTSCLGDCNTCDTGTCMPVPGGQDPKGACFPSVCDGAGYCGVCEPNTFVGECCIGCAKHPSSDSAVPDKSDSGDPCCTQLKCLPNGQVPDCL